MSQPTETERRFEAWLQALVEDQDRATLAALRRGLSVERAENAWMLRYLPAAIGGRREEDYMCMVSSLFAFHPKSWVQSDERGLYTNLGASLARLADQERRKYPASTSTEARFKAILKCHPGDLFQHLKRVIGVLKAHDIPVDWAQLLHDISRWGWESKSVQREWARAFWRSGQDQVPNQSPTEAELSTKGEAV